MSRARRRVGAATTTVVRDLCFVVVLLAAAGLSCWPLYRDGWLAVTVGTGTLGAILACLVMHRLRLPWMVQVPVAVAWALLLGVPAALPDHTFHGFLPTPRGIGELLRGLVNSWADVISVDPPLGRYGDVLVPVFVISYVAGWAAAAGSLRGRRVPGVLGVAALLVYGIAFGPSTGSHPVEIGAAMTVVALVWSQVIRPSPVGVDRTHTRRLRIGNLRRVLVATALVLICAVASGLITTALGNKDRHVARTGFEAHYRPQQQTAPLQEYRSWVTGDRERDTVATVHGLASGTMLRVAVLDSYDGVAFRTSEEGEGFARLPSSVSRPAGKREHVRIGLKRPLGEWVPLAGVLERADLPGTTRDRFYYDRELDAAVVRGGLPRDSQYTLHSVVDAPAARGGLSRLRPAETTQPDLAVLPEDLVAAADQVTADQDTPGKRLQAVLDLLHDGYVSHSGPDEDFSRSGHSAERLDQLVDEEPMLGDAEQYAAAFAILARQQGFDSRVVLGFVDQDDDGKIRGADLTAWVEVADAERGWVAVDPNPEPRPVRKQDRSKEDAVSLPRTVLPPDTPTRNDPTPPTADNSRSQDLEEEAAWREVVAVVWFWTWRIGALLLILTAPLWINASAKAVRRARRRRADVRGARLSGAWDEIRDQARDAGFDPGPAATRSEIAAAVAPDDVPGTPGEGLVAELGTLARRIDRSSFSPRTPDREEIEETWRLSRGLRRRMRSAPQTRRRRLRRRFAWRSLRRR